MRGNDSMGGRGSLPEQIVFANAAEILDDRYCLLRERQSRVLRALLSSLILSGDPAAAPQSNGAKITEERGLIWYEYPGFRLGFAVAHLDQIWRQMRLARHEELALRDLLHAMIVLDHEAKKRVLKRLLETIDRRDPPRTAEVDAVIDTYGEQAGSLNHRA